MRKLLSDKVSLMDLSSVSKSHKIQRINVESSFMTKLKRNSKLRSTLEAKKMLCGNEGLF